MDNLWQTFTSTPYFGILLSVVVYLIGVYLFRISRKFFLFTPLFVAMILGAIFLKVAGLDYQTTYAKGGDIIFFFLTPATVALAIPLYKMVKILKYYYIQILLSIFIGSLISVFAVYFIGLLFGVGHDVIKSIVPQAATTAIAIPIAESIGGIAAITGFTVILNAAIVFGAGSFFLDFFKVKNPISRGLGMGTAGHALGAARSIELGPVEAAMASIAVVVVGVITVFVVQLFVSIVY